MKISQVNQGVAIDSNTMAILIKEETTITKDIVITKATDPTEEEEITTEVVTIISRKAVKDNITRKLITIKEKKKDITNRDNKKNKKRNLTTQSLRKRMMRKLSNWMRSKRDLFSKSSTTANRTFLS